MKLKSQNMPIPDPKYIPKARGKKKTVKKHAPAVATVFPAPSTRKEVKPLKKTAPRGGKYVWAN